MAANNRWDLIRGLKG